MKPGLALVLAVAAVAVVAAHEKVAFPEGRTEDGVRYRTAYQCEGDRLELSCDDVGGANANGNSVISVVRANFGRFSIAICNKQGYTDWSVNCMAHQTTNILKKRCDGQHTCSMPVSSSEFGSDPCPGTQKYVEVHYACADAASSAAEAGAFAASTPPPWLQEGLWHEREAGGNSDDREEDSARRGRKPILVHAVPATVAPQVRIPITTPKPTTSTTTTTTTITTTTTRTTSTTSSQRMILSDFVAEEDEDEDESEDEFQDESIFETTEPEVPLDTTEFCPRSTTRSVSWNWTRAGETAIRPCPFGATGLARWACVRTASSAASEAAWTSANPDLSDCKSPAITDLELRIRRDADAADVASALADLTQSPRLVGGDLDTTVAVIKMVSNRLAYALQTRAAPSVADVRGVLVDVVRAAEHVLAADSRLAWADIGPAAVKTGSGLLKALEANALIAADVGNDDEDVEHRGEEVVCVASVMGSSSDRTWTGFSNDSVTISGQHSLDSLAFFAFRSLHDLLAYSKDAAFALNSRVVAVASRVSNGVPVDVRLRHLTAASKAASDEAMCVRWDHEHAAWTGDGCVVVGESDAEATLCRCDRLGAFAVMMPSTGAGSVFTASTTSVSVEDAAASSFTLEIVTYAVAVICVVILVLILLQFRKQIRASCQRGGCCTCCSRRHSSDKKEAADRLASTSAAASTHLRHFNEDAAKTRPSTGTTLASPLHRARGPPAGPSGAAAGARPLRPRPPSRPSPYSTATAYRSPIPGQDSDSGGHIYTNLLYSSLYDGARSTGYNTRTRPIPPPRDDRLLALLPGTTLRTARTSPRPTPWSSARIPLQSMQSTAMPQTMWWRPPDNPTPTAARLSSTSSRRSSELSPALSARDASSSACNSYFTDVTYCAEEHDSEYDEHVYCEIPAAAAAAESDDGRSAFRGHHRAVRPGGTGHPGPGPAKTTMTIDEHCAGDTTDEDTASDVHNLSDLSEDERALEETSRSDASGQSNASARKLHARPKGRMVSIV